MIKQCEYVIQVKSNRSFVAGKCGVKNQAPLNSRSSFIDIDLSREENDSENYKKKKNALKTQMRFLLFFCFFIRYENIPSDPHHDDLLPRGLFPFCAIFDSVEKR